MHQFIIFKMLTDTHTHLYLDEFENTSADAVRRAIEAGVCRLVFPNVDITTIEPMKALSSMFPLNTYMAMGFHPTEVSDNWHESLAAIYEHLTDGNRYVAIGEIGMDLYWDKTYREQQMSAFEEQIRWAVDRQLPVIIHCREALDETLEVLEGFKGKKISGVFHSFGGTPDDVEIIRKRAGDFYFGINGIVTFKNCKVRESLQCIGSGRLLLETDSPYLAPVPHRGKRNESAYLIHTAAYVAQTLGLGLQEISEITNANADNLFGF